MHDEADNFARNQNKELIDFLLSRKRKRENSRVGFKIRMWEFTVAAARVTKRLIDIALATALLIIFSPVLLLVALWIKLDSRGPLIHRQVRVGLNGRHFHFYKFRSMHVGAEAERKLLEARNESGDGVIFKIKKDPRITRCGRFIRKYSIDELPQLFNVLAGDMSLVGPRPPLVSEVDQYSLDDRKRLQVLPGITGLWQISGRSDIPFHEQVKLDKEYIKSHSIKQDIVILLKTIPAVLSGKGAY